MRSTPRSVLVTETSSYQLENIETFHPTIPVLLNVTPDHLEHHGTMRAYAVALAGGIGVRAIRRVLERFRGVEHRLEFVRHLEGVRYINDSKATNVDSTRVALASFREPLLVIMGGRGKGSPYAPLKALVRR